MEKNIGPKVKEIRKEKGYTLKTLSKKTDLSVGFLSQFERGLTSIAVDSLKKIAKILEIDISTFFKSTQNRNEDIIKSHEREILEIENQKFIHYLLTNKPKERSFLPKIVEILPMKADENLKPYKHNGEEFVYVLEGILTLYLKDEKKFLYPGDSAHYDSCKKHNWSNETNKKVKLLTIHSPNQLKEE